MKNQKTPIDNLDKVIAEALEDYQTEVMDGATKATKDIVKAGAKVVQAAAEAAVGGTYYKSGWTGTVEYQSRRRYYVRGVIHNTKAPGLAHLLENGHAIKRGGRTFGQTRKFPHLAKAEEQINERYESAIKVML